MSRIGRKPIVIPAGVEVKIDGETVKVTGPKGTLTQRVHSGLGLEVEGNELKVSRPSDDRQFRSLHGLTRTLIHNMVTGVTEGFKKELEISGVGSEMSSFSTSATATPSGSSIQMRSRPKCPTPQRSLSTASINRLSASLRQRSAVCVLRNPTRARESTMSANTSSAKKAKPVKLKEGEKTDYDIKERQQQAASSAA